MSDKELLTAAQSGDETAFRHLFEKYWEGLVQFACKRMHSKDDASDMVQDVFLSLWNNIQHVEIDDSLAAYLFVALRNKIFNYYEKQTLRLKYLLNQPFNPVESEEHIWSAINNKELQAFIKNEVSLMPAKMKDIYLLSREQQFSVAEIANLMMLSPQTIKNQLHRALTRIRQSLQKNNMGIFIFLI